MPMSSSSIFLAASASELSGAMVATGLVMIALSCILFPLLRLG